jgi:hypothetical protein
MRSRDLFQSPEFEALMALLGVDISASDIVGLTLLLPSPERPPEVIITHRPMIGQRNDVSETVDGGLRPDEEGPARQDV